MIAMGKGTDLTMEIAGITQVKGDLYRPRVLKSWNSLANWILQLRNSLRGASKVKYERE